MAPSPSPFVLADKEESSFLANRDARLAANTTKAKARADDIANNSTLAESTSSFLQSYNSTYQSTVSNLSSLPTQTVTSAARTDVLEALTKATRVAIKMRSDTASASMFLNPYDVRQVRLPLSSSSSSSSSLNWSKLGSGLSCPFFGFLVSSCWFSQLASLVLSTWFSSSFRSKNVIFVCQRHSSSILA